MLRIKREFDGTHTINGEIFIPCGSLYRKTTLTEAVRMNEPFRVETLEGVMEGKAGDWLMIGAKGEMYPCDADVFEKTYELVCEVKNE